ncbi:hypothetical protein [Streptomyces sp. NPDC059783]|uniref:hypothetical protein n=1 Tax=Streptomyces sp. NPDC059783 TaxID=3346944 RepID=UPI0036580A58
MTNWTPMQKRALVAALVLLVALFPNLLMVVVPVAGLLVWAAGQTLIVGGVVGALLATSVRGEWSGRRVAKSEGVAA